MGMINGVLIRVRIIDLRCLRTNSEENSLLVSKKEDISGDCKKKIVVMRFFPSDDINGAINLRRGHLCSTYGEDEKPINFVEKLRRKDNFGDIGIKDRIILKWIGRNRLWGLD
jgi:hypothetical protein